MASKSITITLSGEGLKEANLWLMRYKRKLKDLAGELLGRMLNEGEHFAANALGHIDTGMTLSTLMAYRQGNHGMIVVGGNAIWIEFGTGVLHNTTDDVHDRKALGISNWGTYVQDGSGIVSNGSRADGWYYYNEERQQVEHTEGIPMNPFMYNTAKMLREEYANYAREIFK